MGSDFMFNDMIKKLKGQNKRIVFTEGEDIRVLTAAARLANEGVLVPVVLGRKDVISKLAKENKLNISKLEIIQIDQFEKTEELVERMFELRKGKMTLTRS
jgi:phosphate acetyltransferase